MAEISEKQLAAMIGKGLKQGVASLFSQKDGKSGIDYFWDAIDQEYVYQDVLGNVQQKPHIPIQEAIANPSIVETFGRTPLGWGTVTALEAVRKYMETAPDEIPGYEGEVPEEGVEGIGKEEYASLLSQVAKIEKDMKLSKFDDYLEEIEDEGVDYEEALVKGDRKGDSKELYEVAAGKWSRYDDSEVARKFGSDEIVKGIDMKYKGLMDDL